MSRFAAFAERKSASLLISVIGFVVWGIVYYLVTIALNAWVETGSELAESLNSFMGAVLMSVFPVISAIGFYVGVQYVRKHDSHGLAIFGILVNALWLAFFVLAFLVIFVLGASA